MEFLISLLPPHTPEHNGFFERRHPHIVETGLTLLSHASIPLTYWPHAFTTTIYLINCMPTPTLNLFSPYENIFGTTPNYSKLKIFDCLYYPWLQLYTTHKLESRSKPCVFLGYSLTQSAYHCLDPTTSKIYVSRYVQFVESLFPFTYLSQHLPRPQSTTIAIWFSPPICVTSLSPLPPINFPSVVVVSQQSPSDASSPTSFPNLLPKPVTQHPLEQLPPPTNPPFSH